MMRLTAFPALLIVLLPAGCDRGRVVADEDSPYYSVSIGSTFTLNREIAIQPDQTSVYLQDGKIETAGNVDIYRPHCKFELYTISDQARTVKPDTFVVTGIVDRHEDVSVQRPLYASLDVVLFNGPMHLTWSTAMYLESEQQPDVYRMDCKRWDWINTGEYLSISEMRRALGEYFTLTLAG